MKLFLLAFFIFLFQFNCSAQKSPVQYLGQTPPMLTPEIFAPGVISTKESEFGLAISPDGKEFYFCRSLSASVIAIQVVKYENGEWTEAVTLPFSGNDFDMDPCLSCDGGKLFFGSTRFNGKHNVSGCDIWISDRDERNNWSEPYLIDSKINTPGNESSPCLSAGGTLYFHSKKHKGNGGIDIFKSELVNGEYGKPENLGDAVNSSYNDFDAFIPQDESYIIFCSERRKGSYGNGDLYISFRNNDGTWTDAVNMGREINSKAIDYSPFVSPDGKFLFFSSYRNNTGSIYWVDAKIIEELRP